jgi:hypothetical protein
MLFRRAFFGALATGLLVCTACGGQERSDTSAAQQQQHGRIQNAQVQEENGRFRILGTDENGAQQETVVDSVTLSAQPGDSRSGQLLQSAEGGPKCTGCTNVGGVWHCEYCEF